MSNAVRLVLIMATRVYEFLLAFPDPNPGFMVATEALGARLARAETLANQQRTGHVDRRVSRGQRESLLKKIRSTFLRTLLGVAGAAFKHDPELVRRFRVLHRDVNSDFPSGARSALAEAEGVKEVLLQYGLPETFLADMGAALDQYDELVTEANAGWRAHVGASADLDVVADEITGIVRHLDALNRYRYRDNPEQLAAWVSARNVPRTSRAKDAVPVPVPAPVPAATATAASPQPTS